MSEFKITAAMLNDFCKAGMKVGEMAAKITEESGNKCSVGTVKKACEHYGISLKSKPRKSVFKFDDEMIDSMIESKKDEIRKEEEVNF